MSTNPPVAPETSPAEAPTATSPPPIAPAWHTALFVVVIFAFSALSAHSQHQMVERHGRVAPYLLTMAWEYVLVGFILWGARKKGVTLREIVGGRWKSPESLLVDVAIAFTFWIAAAGILAGLSFALGLTSPSQVAEAKKQLGAL